MPAGNRVLVSHAEGMAKETHYSLAGCGPPLVLIHGVGLDLTMWDAQAEALALHFQVIRYDLLGHGESGDPPGERSLADFVGQLAALLDALGHDRAALAGFSIGALIARAFALAHGERLTKLALLYGVYKRSPDQDAAILARIAQAEREGPRALIEAAMERWFSPAFRAADPPVIARVRQRLESNRPEAFLKAYRIFGRSEAEMAAFSGAIDCPCLVAAGEKDPGSTPEMARALAADIPGARLAILPGHRHLGPLEDPAPFNALLLDFLEG